MEGTVRREDLRRSPRWSAHTSYRKWRPLVLRGDTGEGVDLPTGDVGSRHNGDVGVRLIGDVGVRLSGVVGVRVRGGGVLRGKGEVGVRRRGEVGGWRPWEAYRWRECERGRGGVGLEEWVVVGGDAWLLWSVMSSGVTVSRSVTTLWRRGRQDDMSPGFMTRACRDRYRATALRAGRLTRQRQVYISHLYISHVHPEL